MVNASTSDEGAISLTESEVQRDETRTHVVQLGKLTTD
jgi:hypothetical protein